MVISQDVHEGKWNYVDCNKDGDATICILLFPAKQIGITKILFTVHIMLQVTLSSDSSNRDVLTGFIVHAKEELISYSYMLSLRKYWNKTDNSSFRYYFNRTPLNKHVWEAEWLHSLSLMWEGWLFSNRAQLFLWGR